MESIKATNSVENYGIQHPENSRYSEIIEHLSTCCLCGGHLAYHHETDYLLLTVREEAHCPSCGIRTKRESHSIQ